jgi:hypothetical protein
VKASVFPGLKSETFGTQVRNLRCAALRMTAL